FTDRVCPDDIKTNAASYDVGSTFGPSRQCALPQTNGSDPTGRFGGARFMLQGALEMSVHPIVTIFAIFEGDISVQGRPGWDGKWSTGLLTPDPMVYGRLGASFKF
ncbi:MAG TPA: hypothetical protein VFF06_00525, partial [Polyangia bacterium]|nr:hypothetical protein [Polyangia bacterium]